MINIVPKAFDIQKAKLVLDSYGKNRELLKAHFVHDLINHQNYEAPKSILYHDIMIRKHYPKELIESVLNDLGYDLVFYKPAEEFGPGSDFSVIAIGIKSQL